MKKISIITEVAIFFAIGIISIGLLTYVSQRAYSRRNVEAQTETHAADIAEEVRRAVTEYPAYQWLIRYWYTYPRDLEIEYDAAFADGGATAEKCRTFAERHPDLQLRYIDMEQCGKLPAEDQKLYAEIAYSWLITRIDEIKQAYHVDYLFCVITEEPYDKQFFLLSGADPGAVRGTHYEEVYPLGHVVRVSQSQTEAMRSAVRNSSHLADAGNYLDYYTVLCSFHGHNVLIGLTYDLSDMQRNIEAQTRNGALLAILNQIALSVVLLVLISLFVLRPLKKVKKNVLRYKETKDSREVQIGLAAVQSRNDIGELAEDVSEMIREIDSHVDKIRSITAETERIGTELALATRIQADMVPNTFPAFPGRTEFDIHASMDPAKEVGGDFYNFFLIDEDHLCLYIADVSGKGVPAALFMMASQIILASNAKLGRTPAQILMDTNETICSHNRQEMFVTVWLGILEISTGKLTAANAGHEYPALLQPDGSFALVKNRHGFVIGGMSGMKYRDFETTLLPGARLFLYTDGVAEAADASNAMFGTDRMIEALNRQPDGKPEVILGNVRAAVDDFVKDAEQFDDVTMLCLAYYGKAAT